MELWTPGQATDKVAVAPKTVMHQPEERKTEGGSFFDDEMQTEESHQAKLAEDVKKMVSHLNARPDHAVYVSSTEEREKMRAVFNYWRQRQWLGHNPNIRIEYGVPEGNVRIAP